MSTVVYEIVDVFTDRAFAGNPLAVVFGAEALTGGQMQAMAREFNLSETAFVLPPTDPAATYRVRIFTPATELPFAGHPSLGAAVTQQRRGLFEPGPVVQECLAGLLPVTVAGDGTGVLTGGTPTAGPERDPGSLLAGLGLTVDDHLGPAPSAASCGMPFVFLRVRPGAVARARLVDPAAIDDLCLLAWDPPSRTAQVRVFAPGAGVAEDPATGSAALALGAWCVFTGLLPGDGTATFLVHQGAEVGRPSILCGSVTASDGRPVSTTVSGQVVPIATGIMQIPSDDG
ncbi:MAG: PhzF family phenazine biosynthesis protein [Dactylosporangium sp.]|nr:PhzF family phenazine biosynthesis protein [Dactylosporangium sp.]NNJ62616.1 PhzF family phenazine biosynthesis protein [Dactylosporangium sp.]